MSRLMLKQEYPPTKVQPQPSATRDDGATRLNRALDYDKIDAEAGSILIALANQEPQRLKSEDAKRDNNRSTDGDGDVVMTSSNQKSGQNGSDMQSVVSGGNQSSSSSMSISSLLGGGNDGQRAEQDPIMMLAAAAAAIDGRSDESAGLYSVERPEKRSTGASYGYYSQHYTQPAERPNGTQYHKAKSRGYYYEKDVDDTHSRTQRHHQPPPASLATGRASRYHSSDPANQAGARPEGTNAFSYQYMSMTWLSGIARRKRIATTITAQAATIEHEKAKRVDGLGNIAEHRTVEK
ncbi:hypothetical protein BJV82DRAFT_574107 [Fennellomyces sp. T-0311]|nr:hypothetical protein BJV82DRAFT_574107 [Fennellomyces sp. T-0311]